MIGVITAQLLQELKRIWCYRWLAAVTTVLLLCAGVSLVMTLPPIYDAWGQIYVNRQTPAAAAAQGVSFSNDSAAAATVIARTLLNDEHLEPLVRQLNPAAKDMTGQQLARATAGLKAKIQLSGDPSDGFVELHVKDIDPARAQRIAQMVINVFIARNLELSDVQLRQAGAFLDEQITAYENMLAESRARMAAFQAQHPGFQASPLGFAVTADPAEPAQPRIAAAPQVSAGAVALAAANERVAAAQARLAALRTQYTDEYPDVVMTRRQLDQALAEREQLKSQASSAGAQAVSAFAPRPWRPRAHSAPPSPALQSEWAELQKNDEMLRLNYQQLIARREGARVSRAVDGADGGRRFQITRQPLKPLFPVGPKRHLYLAAVAVMALGGGLGAAYLRAAIAGIFVSPREVENAFQLPVIGTVAWEPAWSTASPRRGALATFRAALAWRPAGPRKPHAVSVDRRPS